LEAGAGIPHPLTCFRPITRSAPKFLLDEDKMITRTKWVLVMAGLGVLAAGCESPTIIPNPDPQLRKTSAQLAADSAKRFPYKASAPRGQGLTARAEVNYNLNLRTLSLVNLSKQDLNEVEVWVNQQYVIYVPQWKDHELKRLDFKMIFDDSGNYFPTDNSAVRVNKVEVLVAGNMYDVPLRLAD
jgi:hypothetical protein